MDSLFFSQTFKKKIKCASFLSKLGMIFNLMIKKKKGIGIDETFLQPI